MNSQNDIILLDSTTLPEVDETILNKYKAYKTQGEKDTKTLGKEHKKPSQLVKENGNFTNADFFIFH